MNKILFFIGSFVEGDRDFLTWKLILFEICLGRFKYQVCGDYSEFS